MAKLRPIWAAPGEDDQVVQRGDEAGSEVVDKHRRDDWDAWAVPLG